MTAADDATGWRLADLERIGGAAAPVVGSVTVAPLTPQLPALHFARDLSGPFEFLHLPPRNVGVC